MGMKQRKPNQESGWKLAFCIFMLKYIILLGNQYKGDFMLCRSAESNNSQYIYLAHRLQAEKKKTRILWKPIGSHWQEARDRLYFFAIPIQFKLVLWIISFLSLFLKVLRIDYIDILQKKKEREYKSDEKMKKN